MFLRVSGRSFHNCDPITWNDLAANVFRLVGKMTSILSLLFERRLWTFLAFHSNNSWRYLGALLPITDLKTRVSTLYLILWQIGSQWSSFIASVALSILALFNINFAASDCTCHSFAMSHSGQPKKRELA